jgi:ABC-type uncharacterized transport system involved in gliding motility auxiliary subunit
MSFATKLTRRALVWGCLIMALVTLLSVNVLSGSLFQSAKIDLTQEKLYTLSKGTHDVLGAIDEPILVRLYFSSEMGEAVPLFQRYFERVRSLLETYADLSGGKLVLEVYDPEPFSDAEDRAVAAGLTGVPLNDEGVNGYFGYSATNSTDNRMVEAFMSLERERFLEYDLTKMIYSLANPVKQVVGVLTPFPMVGGYDLQQGQRPDWQVIAALRELFDVRSINPQSNTIPDDISMLIIAQPVGLSDQLLYAIDQFALKGGKVLAFADPNAEIGRGQVPGIAGGVRDTGFERLLNAWGVVLAEGAVVGDIDHGRRVQFGSASNPTVVDYVAWMALDTQSMDGDDAVSAGIERLNFATAGALEQIEGATTRFAPLVSSGPRAMKIGVDQFAMSPNPVALLEQYVPGEEALVVAARVLGEARSAFPDGPPPEAADADAEAEGGAAQPDDGADEAEGEASGHVADGTVNLVVVADVDFLYDSLWVQVQNFMGSQVAVPVANNGDLVLNVMDNLSGGAALIGLRGRGVQSRPFHLVEEIRRASEERFREREQTLNAKLEELQGNLSNLQRTADGGTVILTGDQEEAIETFRQEMIAVRGQLRDVKLALRRDIDRLDLWLKFGNIAAVPIFIAFLGLFVLAYRRSRQRARRATA